MNHRRYCSVIRFVAVLAACVLSAFSAEAAEQPMDRPQPMTAALAFSTTSLSAATYKAAYSATIVATGGSGKYSFAVNGTTIPTTGVATTISSGGGLTGANKGTGTLTLAGKPTSYPAVTLKVTVTDTTNKTTKTATYTLTVYSLAVSVETDAIPQGMVGMPFTFANVNVSGGKSSYTYAFSNVPAGLTGKSTGMLVGKPTAAGTTTVTVTVKDSSTTKQVGSTTFVVRVVAATSAAYNTRLKGQYSCMVEEYWDGGVTAGSYKYYRGGVALAFVANGSGKITSGEVDSNSPSSGYSYTSSLTGTYVIGAYNRGYINIGSGSAIFAVAGGNLNSSGYFSQLSLVLMDDAGSSATGVHGSGQCFLQSTGTMKGSSPSGGYVFLFEGESSSGGGKAMVGRVNFSSNTMSGIDDAVSGTKLKNSETVPSMTYVSADALGRMVLKYSGTQSMVAYLTKDSKNNVILMNTVGHTASSTNDFFMGLAKAQSAANIKASYPITGNAVLHVSGAAASSSGTAYYMAMMTQVKGSTSAKSIAINSIVKNKGGTYSLDSDTIYGKSTTYAVDTTTGRTTLGSAANVYLYLWDTNAAAVLWAETDSSGYRKRMTGWLEPQTTSGSWDIGDLTASYFMHKSLNNSPDADGTTATFSLASDGTMSNFAEDDGGQNWASWEEPVTGTPGLSGTGKIALNSKDGASYGLMDIKVTVSGTTSGVAECYAISVDAAINSKTKGKLVCMDKSGELADTLTVQE